MSLVVRLVRLAWVATARMAEATQRATTMRAKRRVANSRHHTARGEPSAATSAENPTTSIVHQACTSHVSTHELLISSSLPRLAGCRATAYRRCLSCPISPPLPPPQPSRPHWSQPPHCCQTPSGAPRALLGVLVFLCPLRAPSHLPRPKMPKKKAPRNSLSRGALCWSHLGESNSGPAHYE